MRELSINEIIETAVQIEISGYSFYNEALSRKELSEKCRNLITFLRDQEIEHEKTFKGLRDTIDNLELDNTTDWDVVSSYLKAIIDSRIFNSPESAIALVKKTNNEIDIIDYAIQFEKDTLLYFHTIHANLKDEKSKKVVKRIIDEEVNHVKKLCEIKKEL